MSEEDNAPEDAKPEVEDAKPEVVVKPKTAQDYYANFIKGQVAKTSMFDGSKGTSASPDDVAISTGKMSKNDIRK